MSHAESPYETLDGLTALTCSACQQGQVTMLPAECPVCKKVLDTSFNIEEILENGKIRQYVCSTGDTTRFFNALGPVTVFSPYIPLQITNAGGTE